MRLKGDVLLEEATVEAPLLFEERFSEQWLWRRGLMAWLFALVVQAVANLMPRVVESAYSHGFYFFLVRLQAIFSDTAGSALGEMLIMLLAITAGFFVIWLLWQQQIKRLLLFLFWLSGVGFASSLVLWGMNYQREPLAITMGLPARAVATWELDAIGQSLIGEVNTRYLEAYDRNPDPGLLPISTLELYQVLEESFQNEPLLRQASSGGLANPKPLQLSKLMTRLGVSGYYIPYTGEATYNDLTPASELPFVIAHEKAHQRGYARENEADFIAFVVCIEAANPYVQYSGYLYALRELANADPEGFSGLSASLEPGPTSDLQNSRDFWANEAHPTLSLLANYINDAHLRANRVPSGIGNYDEDAELIVRYLCDRFKLCNP